ncbi:methyltransferase [Fuscovulum blasticum]|uniref:methyltransferase n=1 Tax=Fuscovulum blasticum TaxID=1075 RepID=UPI000D3E7E73|nr:methyltransferase [Fuscovulum blasticum]AWD21597.1 hypothetical protein B6K69_07850 [Fuscovulum blasticum]
MTQNRSSAVMQQRREPHDSLDDFPTPPWSTRALFDHLQNTLLWLHTDEDSCREPAANRGHMVGPLKEYFRDVEASDVHDYGAGFPVQDYLWGPDPDPVDWTVTNPPFRLADQFIARALRTSRQAVAVIVRSAFLEGIGRYESLFKPYPPRLILQFSERVVMHRGRLSPTGSTATAYCWIIWETHQPRMRREPEFGWIPPCRRRLERPGDYDVPEGCR